MLHEHNYSGGTSEFDLDKKHRRFIPQCCYCPAGLTEKHSFVTVKPSEMDLRF